MATVAELRAKGNVRPTSRSGTTITIGTTQTQVLPANPHRVGFVLIGDVTNSARIAIGRTGIVSSTVGMPLDSEAGVLAADFEQYGTAVGLPVYGAAGSTATVYIEEYEVFE